MSNYILVTKDQSENTKQFERNTDLYKFKNIPYLDRPICNYNKNNKQEVGNFANYMISQKTILGYNHYNQYEDNKQCKDNNIIPKSVEHVQNIKPDITLPLNIYHNFSKSTRLSKKKVNYDINSRNLYSRTTYRK